MKPITKNGRAWPRKTYVGVSTGTGLSVKFRSRRAPVFRSKLEPLTFPKHPIGKHLECIEKYVRFEDMTPMSVVMLDKPYDPEEGPLYWSNETGWGSFEGATEFTDKERAKFNLPEGGRWMP